MKKFFKVSEAAHGAAITPGEAPSAIVPLEKMSEDLEGQLRYLQDSQRIDPRLVEWVRSAKIDPDKETCSIVLPLGAYESWGATLNGDGFERDWMKPRDPEWGHQSFERYGRAYLHHKNSDPSIAYGDTPAMFWDDAMDRAVGIWRLWNDRANEVNAGHIVKRIRQGRPVEISMGARVPYDVCTECGNKAKTRAEYCSHARHRMGEIDPKTGREICVLNPFPKFFDLSGVIVPAAFEAMVLAYLYPELLAGLRSMMKSSSVTSVAVIPSSVLWEARSEGLPHGGELRKVAEAVEPLKVSAIIKHVPSVEANIVGPLQRQEREMTCEDMTALGLRQAGLEKALSSLAGMGVILRPREFSSLLQGPGRPAYQLPQESVTKGFLAGGFGDLLNTLAFSPSVGTAISRSWVSDRSILLPQLLGRAESAMRGVGAGALPPGRVRVTVDLSLPGTPQDEMGQLYGTYLREVADKLGNVLEHVLTNYPGLSPDEDDHLHPKRFTLLSSREKTASDLSAQALLGPAYVLSMAGQLADTTALMQCIHAWNRPKVAHLMGGVMT